MSTPADVHERGVREYPRVLRDWDYPKEATPRLVVTVNGADPFRQRTPGDGSTALSGRYVGLEEVEDGIWLIWYRHVRLGYFSEVTNAVYEIEDFNL